MASFIRPPKGFLRVAWFLHSKGLHGNAGILRCRHGLSNIRFCRYADDWCVFLTRSNRRNAERLKDEIRDFLRETCGLELLGRKDPDIASKSITPSATRGRSPRKSAAHMLAGRTRFIDLQMPPPGLCGLLAANEFVGESHTTYGE
jgi:hypothetical protein